MAMFPNASRGYMPFAPGQNGHKKSHGVRFPAKHGKNEHKRLKAGKTYQVTLKDKNGFTYTYIVKTDNNSKSLPILCDSMVSGLGSTDSLTNIGLRAPSKRVLTSSMNLPLDTKDDGEKKEGLFSTLIRFLKEKTGKSKAGKSKRKPKPQVQRKRQRTVSAMSNLDPIQESPDEDEYEDDDCDSYTHDCSSVSDSDIGSIVSTEETVDKENEEKTVP